MLRESSYYWAFFQGSCRALLKGAGLELILIHIRVVALAWACALSPSNIRQALLAIVRSVPVQQLPHAFVAAIRAMADDYAPKNLIVAIPPPPSLQSGGISDVAGLR